MTVGIRWMSVGPGGGYGNASEAYRRGLSAAGIPVTWTALGWPSTEWQAGFGPVHGHDSEGACSDDPAGRIDHDTVVVHSTPLWHERLAAEASGRLLAAYTTWETDRLPDESVAILNRYDRVLVPSRFNVEVFRSSGVTVPIWAVPHIAPAVPDRVGGPAARHGSRFVFYLIATWSTRKAIPDAVAAFLMAFGSQDDVELVIHTTPVDVAARARLDPGGRIGQGRHAQVFRAEATRVSLAKALAGQHDVPDIVLSTRGLDQADVDRLHLRGDCFVCLSRGEGWGLGAFEAAAFGNPVIVTGWGATREFLPAGYPYFVDYDLIPTTDDQPDAWWQPRQGECWAKARIPHAAALLRHVFAHRADARSWGRMAQSHVVENFGRTGITRRLLQALSPEAGPARSPAPRSR
jgi:glycosyltransferase involved in cell wall biosynthesis